MALYCELFDGLASFFDKFKNRNCLHLEWFKHKSERIEDEIRQLGAKIVRLREKLQRLDSDDDSEEIEQVLGRRLRKLSHQLEKLTVKLFRTIDEFFRKNAHIKDREFCAYKTAYESLKWQLTRVLRELKEACEKTEPKSSEEAESSSLMSDEDDDQEENNNNEHRPTNHQGWIKKIDNKKHFKRVVKYLLKSIESFYRKCVVRRQREINHLKNEIIRLKFELVKLLKKVKIFFYHFHFYIKFDFIVYFILG